MMAVLIITGLCFCIGYALALAARQLSPDPGSVTEQINRILPQTQCAQCGYPGCKPYAEAIARGTARINQCPPGGDEVIRQLARLLDREVLPLDTDFGSNQPETVALIDEAVCIGCTLCIHACPVDAIVGAGKYMHTVIASECTGCELCLPPCPVDCITLIPAKRIPANRAPAQSLRATRINPE